MESQELHIPSIPKRPGRSLRRWLYYRYRLRFQIFRRDKFTCQYCGRTAAKDGAKLTLDHILPRIAGGDWDSENLITACLVCNQGKADDTLLGFEAAGIKNEAVSVVGWGSFKQTGGV